VDFDLDELAADPRYVHIKVCLEHGGLYDDRPDPETGRQQRCHDRGAEPTWHGYDFNEWIRLCDCCLAVPMHSGSRWSPFFCSCCQPEILAAQRGIPIGRHSLMNRTAPSDIVSMVDAIEQLDRWKAQHVQHVAAAPTDPPLATFLGADMHPSDAVRDLLDWWNGPSSTGDDIPEPHPR
jgi:hypothetical protein